MVGALLIASATVAGCDREAPASPRQPNIVLITIDTLRADHLSSYGYPRETSPNIDALAAEGRRFARAQVQWPKTGPSFASILTSTYPKDNGIVRHVGIPMSCRQHTLAESLKDLGYRTQAIVANGALAREFGFDQGFDRYVESWKAEDVPEGLDPDGAEAVNRLVKQALDQLEATTGDGADESDQGPLFLWVHYLDPHHPYTPTEAFRDRFLNDEHYDPSERFEIAPNNDQEMVQVGRRKVLEGRDDLDFYVARYDEEIAYVDDAVGQLLAMLEGRGVLEHAVTVLTSDHGESLGEHYYYFDHGRFGFQTCLNVPFMVRYPGAVEPGVDEAPVGLIDLTPTLLEWAGAPLEDGRFMQGRSLVPRIAGVGTDHEADPTSGVVFSEAGYAERRRWQRVAMNSRFKLVHAPAGREQMFIGGRGVPFALFDLENDPGETENVADAFPEEVERLKRALRRHWNAPAFDVMTDPPGCDGDAPTSIMDPETEEQLRALGYID